MHVVVDSILERNNFVYEKKHVRSYVFMEYKWEMDEKNAQKEAICLE